MASLANVWKTSTRGSDDRSHTWTIRRLDQQLIAQQILHDHRDPTFLPVQASVDFANAIGEVLVMLSLVANHTDQKVWNIWNAPTKLHYLHHLGEKAMFLNPRKGNTMAEDTFMGVAKTIAGSCINATDGLNMPKTYMDKYLWALYLMYTYGDKFTGDEAQA